MWTVNIARSVVETRIRGIDQQAGLLHVSAIRKIGVRERLAPCIGKLRVERFHAGAEKSLQGVVVRTTAPECGINRSPITCSKGTHRIVIAKGEGHTLAGRNEIGIRVSQQVKASVADICEFQLGVADKFPLDGKVPLPGVGKNVAWILTEPGSTGSGQGTWRRRCIE